MCYCSSTRPGRVLTRLRSRSPATNAAVQLVWKVNTACCCFCFFLMQHVVVFSVIQRDKAFQNRGKKLCNRDIEKKTPSRPLLEVLYIVYMNRKLFETHLTGCTFRGVTIFIHLQRDCKCAVSGTAYKHLRASFTWCNPLQTNALESTVSVPVS